MKANETILNNVLLLIVPNIALFRRYPYIQTPLGPSLVAGGLIENGFDVDYVDLNLELNNWQRVHALLSKSSLDYLKSWHSGFGHTLKVPADIMALLGRIDVHLASYSPDYVAVSLNRVTVSFDLYDVAIGFTMLMSVHLKKSKNCPVIWGGQILNNIDAKKVVQALECSVYKCVDYVFYGEGAVALPKLLLSLGEQGKPGKDFYEHIKFSNQAVYCLDDGGRYVNCEEAGGYKIDIQRGCVDVDVEIEKKLLKIKPSFDIKNRALYPTSFDEVFPSYTEDEWLSNKIDIKPYKFMYGCSHRCAFCKASTQKVVYLPPKQVVSDLEYYSKELGIRQFSFLNSQINFSNRYIEELCEEIKSRRLDIMFSDSASFRKLNKDICRQLRKAGCVKLWFGLESPIPRILNLINKDLTREEAIAGIKNAHEAGFWIGVNIIVGFPHETDEEFEDLCRFIEDCKGTVNCWGFSSLEVHPKTPMFNYPENFSIKIHHKYTREEALYGYAFSEIGGLDWKSREERAERRVDYLVNLASPKLHRFSTDDYLIYALYSKYRKKEKVALKFAKYYKRLKRSIDMNVAGKWLNYKYIDDFDCGALTDYLKKYSLLNPHPIPDPF